MAAGIASWSPNACLVMVPALLPLIGLAPWTGWITFEEFDLLVLAVAAGGYGRRAWHGTSQARHQRTQRPAISALPALVMLLFAGSTLWAMARGFGDAGGFSFGWFQGYLEPMNSVRLAKSFFWALLLLPLWQHAYRKQPDQAARAICWGMALGLAGASLATVWERMAFTDLLNFSADYRTTGLFWEMHVGGAALDGFLALTMPFAIRELLQARTPIRWGAAAVIAALGSYACLTTFSRGVYLAVPLGVAAFFLLQTLQHRRASDQGPAPQGIAASWPMRLTKVLPIAGFAAGAGWMFQTSGYRGAGALLGAAAIMLPMAGVLRWLAPSQWISGAVAGLLASALLSVMAWLVPKGAYAAYALALTATAGMVWATRGKNISTHIVRPMALAGFMATLTTLVLVAAHWGYAPATGPASTVAGGCLLLVVAAAGTRQPFWPDSPRWQAGTVCVMGLVMAAIAVFGGGSYMGARFATGSGDLDTRLAHWKLGTDMLQGTADWWLGKGLGRFPANDLLVGDLKDHSGDYRLMHEGDHNFLRLTGGLHVNGWGELLRVSQRVAEPGISPRVRSRVRTAMDISLIFDVCEKHLIYNQACLIKEVGVKAAPGQWQNIDTPITGDAVTRGLWYAPKLIAFSVSMETQGGTADLDHLQLIGTDGRDLLSNGDFSDDMAYWFFSSDKNHLPWHIKNMAMNVLFDQGIVGLSLWCLLLAGAMARLTFGKARDHPLAPVLAASLAGFAVVGLFDSLLDVPRLAALFYFVLLIAFTLRRRPGAHEVSGVEHRA